MNLIVDMRNRGLTYLDLWVANVMMPGKHPSDFNSETLGFKKRRKIFLEGELGIA